METDRNLFESASNTRDKRDLPVNKEAESPERKTIIIGKTFWKRLRVAMKINIDSPGYVDVVFRSQEKRIKDALHRIVVSKPLKDGEWIIVGNYDPVDGTIHFNIGSDDIPKDELARVLTHELVHKLQDEEGRFPEMGKKKRLNAEGVDDVSPWEIEAYKLQELLYKEFLNDCVVE